jgi:hypothetical protein
LTVVIAAVLWRHLPRSTALAGIAGLAGWLVYAGCLGGFGVLRDTELKPPGIVFLALPLAALILGIFVFGGGGRLLARHVPVRILLLLQTFRLGVELTLDMLWREGLVPSLMTFTGGNIEFAIAALAPVAAWAAARGAAGRRVAFAWNMAGLVSLANVVLRGVLTAPGPLHLLSSDVPNRAIGLFPFSYIPGFMVPLALVLHIAAWHALSARAARNAYR